MFFVCVQKLAIIFFFILSSNVHHVILCNITTTYQLPVCVCFKWTCFVHHNDDIFLYLLFSFLSLSLMINFNVFWLFRSYLTTNCNREWLGGEILIERLSETQKMQKKLNEFLKSFRKNQCCCCFCCDDNYDK